MEQELDKKLHYHFRDYKLLELALTHPSMNSRCRNKGDYERLEFLGDAVLGLIIADELYHHYQWENEGNISQRHSALVCGKSEAYIAEQIGISPFVKMTKGEERTGGRQKSTILENVMEAIIGAVYLDSDLVTTAQFVRYHWQELLEQQTVPFRDARSRLQEWTQRRFQCLPVYEVLRETGTMHEPQFTMKVSVPGQRWSAEGTAGNKKNASQVAAQQLLDLLLAFEHE